MKRILSLFVAFLLIAGSAHAQAGFRRDPGVGDILGQKKVQSDAHKIFRMVRYDPVTYDGATTLAADSIVVWDLTSDDGITVTTTTTSCDSSVAGIIVQQALTPDADGRTAAQDRGHSNWTWLQTYGISQADNTLIVDFTGQAFGTSTTAGEVDTCTASASDPARVGIAGFFYDSAAAAATDTEVFLRGLD